MLVGVAAVVGGVYTTSRFRHAHDDEMAVAADALVRAVLAREALDELDDPEALTMFFDDHGPPHFHARHADGSAKVRIDALVVIESHLSRRQLRVVLAWAELHQDELMENWRRARAGETLKEIAPLG